MKPYAILTLLASLVLFGCNSNETAPGPRPFVGILSAKKIGSGPSELAKYEVAVHYENVEPGKYEVDIGFGYVPNDNGVRTLVPTASGIYANAYTEVLKQPLGDIRVTIEPTAVRDLKGKLDGKIHVTLAKYPHGKEWPIAGHDVFALPPE